MLQDPSERLERPEISWDEFSVAKMAPGPYARMILTKSLYVGHTKVKTSGSQLLNEVTMTSFCYGDVIVTLLLLVRQS